MKKATRYSCFILEVVWEIFEFLIGISSSPLELIAMHANFEILAGIAKI
jgi:hypothetical protein